MDFTAEERRRFDEEEKRRKADHRRRLEELKSRELEPGCPSCRAAPGEPCHRRGSPGQLLARAHPERRMRAGMRVRAVEADAFAVQCPECWASPMVRCSRRSSRRGQEDRSLAVPHLRRIEAARRLRDEEQ